MNKKEIEELKNKLAEVEDILFYVKNEKEDHRFDEVYSMVLRTQELLATVTRKTN